ncbi:MAG: hypothetical protein V2A71_05135 [Candidatus Eisenbacteria bacterium]
MGFFYFDESIHDRAGFILGAWVCSQSDLTPVVNKAIAEAGLQPGMHEFKSGARRESGENAVHTSASPLEWILLLKKATYSGTSPTISRRVHI